MTLNVVKLNFEEKGSNYLIYRLSFNEESFEYELNRWTFIADQLEKIKEDLTRLPSYSDNQEAWSSHSKIVEQFECVKFFLKNHLWEPLEKIAQGENLERYRDVGNSYKSLKQILEKEYALLWDKLKYGSLIKEKLQAFESIGISKINSLIKSIRKRLDHYQSFQKATEKELLLHAKIYVNDWKEENFDIVFSFENTLDPDLCIFLYQEVYRAMRGEVLAEAQAEVEKMQIKCCEVFQHLKTLPAHKFLCRLDELFLGYNQVSMNKAIFDQQDTAMLLNFIEKFKNAEKNINSKLLNAQEVAINFMEKFPLPNVTKEDFAWLVVLGVTALPTSDILSAKENWASSVEGLAVSLYKKIQASSFEEVVRGTPVKVLPWKVVDLLNHEVASKFWQLWKARYVLNQYPQVEVQDDGIVLTGKKYQDEDGEYPEAVILYLAGMHFEPVTVTKKSSLERNAMTLQQKNFKLAGAASGALGVQLSFIVDKCILNSRHKKKFSM